MCCFSSFLCQSCSDEIGLILHDNSSLVMKELSISNSEVGKTSIFYFLKHPLNAFLTLNSIIFQNNFQNRSNSNHGFFLTVSSGNCRSTISDLSFANNSGCNFKFLMHLLHKYIIKIKFRWRFFSL